MMEPADMAFKEIIKEKKSDEYKKICPYDCQGKRASTCC